MRVLARRRWAAFSRPFTRRRRRHAGLLKGLLAGGSKKIQAYVAKSNAGIAQPPRGFSRFRAKLRR